MTYRKFYNHTANIYRLWSTDDRWSMVQAKTPIYLNIKVSLWRNWSNYRNNNLAVQADMNWYVINLQPQHNGVKVGDIIEIDNTSYKVDNIIPHHRYNGRIDNYDIIVSITAND